MAENNTQRSKEMAALLSNLRDQEYCYLTTTGRVSGRPHEIEIWFGVENISLYLLSGSETSDWVRNLRKDPAVSVRIANHSFTGRARVVEDLEEERTARYLLAEKYQEWEEGRTLSQWARTALPIAIDVKD
ncbi:MAG TPA: nitroreductase/quinone reductase family protein [Anaerolineales bacterium]|nr:nitroreductase/quinone reductase family protein [Anaerolineales bacterium]